MTTLQSIFSTTTPAHEQLTPKHLTDLVLPTGRIVACDPLTYHEPEAFVQSVQPGTYPVLIHLLKEDERVAYAELRIADGEVARWDIAVTPGQDAALLKEDEIFGYPVDAGLGCFMDAETVKLLDRHQEDLATTVPGFSNYYDDYLGKIMAPGSEAENWCAIRPYPDQPNNVAIFQSGWGVGFYATYVGRDLNGGIARFVTEFIDILDEGS